MKSPVRPSATPLPDALGFRFRHGPVAHDLREFHDILALAPAEVVTYHRPHFGAWLRGVLGDEPLARRFEAYDQAGAEGDALRDVLVALVELRLHPSLSPARVTDER
jgi:hypothetical protein